VDLLVDLVAGEATSLASQIELTVKAGVVVLTMLHDAPQ
jgi:hypothetical protein